MFDFFTPYSTVLAGIISLPLFLMGAYPVFDASYHEDAFLDMTSLARKYGYEVRNHTVLTEDGYFLSLFNLIPLNMSDEY